ncbi:unnamed protein product [Symbiodinium sp. CCMP2592]|nr:unnamed protein product [Symbiodinium sp. CCMP2592]
MQVQVFQNVGVLHRRAAACYLLSGLRECRGQRPSGFGFLDCLGRHGIDHPGPEKTNPGPAPCFEKRRSHEWRTEEEELCCPWSDLHIVGGLVLVALSPSIIQACRCCWFLVQQLNKLSTEKDQLLHELRSDNHARWAETQMLQNACISLHSENTALWTEIEQRHSECSNLRCQTNAIWTGSETWRNKCRKLRRDNEKLSKKLRNLEEQAFQAKHCPDMKSKEHVLLRTPPGSPKFRQDDPNHEIAKKRRQKQGSDASLSSVSTCATASDGPPEEFPDASPQNSSPGEACDSEITKPNNKEELPGALRADIGEAHEGTSHAVERLDKKCDGERYELESVAEREQAAIGLCHTPCEALPLVEVEIESDTTSASVKCLDQSEEVLDLRVTAPGSRESEALLWQQFRHNSEGVGSGASSPTESTCDSDGDGSPQELPVSGPDHGSAREACVSETEITDDEQSSIKEELPGALRADIGEAHEGTSSLLEMPHKKRESGASRGSIAADETDSSAAKAAVDPFHPSFEALPVLLHHLSVQDMLDWRVTSRQTRTPEVLLQHVAELGRFDTSASIVAYGDALERLEGSWTRTHSEIFGDDVAYRKRFECQEWCIILARAERTHFAESRVRDIVLENLRHSFSHCLDPDVSVREGAHAVVVNHAYGGLSFVKELIAKTMLSQMRDIMSAGGEIQRAWPRMWLCMQHLEGLLRVLTKPQRQEWVCLLVELLHRFRTTFEAFVDWSTSRKSVIDELKLLWRADDDPARTYADAAQKLRALKHDTDFEGVKQNLHSLLLC